jgi:hypothetical protein
MKMLFHESQIGATAKTRRFALGLVFVLATSGVSAGITPGHDCGVSNAIACECCQSAGTWSGHSLQGSSCCDATFPVQSVPVDVETCNSQRNEKSGLRALRTGETSPIAQQIMFIEGDRKQPQAEGPHAYLMFCSFLI